MADGLWGAVSHACQHLPSLPPQDHLTVAGHLRCQAHNACWFSRSTAASHNEWPIARGTRTPTVHPWLLRDSVPGTGRSGRGWAATCCARDLGVRACRVRRGRLGEVPDAADGANGAVRAELGAQLRNVHVNAPCPGRAHGCTCGPASDPTGYPAGGPAGDPAGGPADRGPDRTEQLLPADHPPRVAREKREHGELGRGEADIGAGHPGPPGPGVQDQFAQGAGGGGSAWVPLWCGRPRNGGADPCDKNAWAERAPDTARVTVARDPDMPRAQPAGAHETDQFRRTALAAGLGAALYAALAAGLAAALTAALCAALAAALCAALATALCTALATALCTALAAGLGAALYAALAAALCAALGAALAAGLSACGELAAHQTGGQPGHGQVEHHYGGRVFAQRRDRVGRGACDVHRQPIARQIPAGKLGHGRLVLDDENEPAVTIAPPVIARWAHPELHLRDQGWGTRQAPGVRCARRRARGRLARPGAMASPRRRG